jgi:uncharacterized protein
VGLLSAGVLWVLTYVPGIVLPWKAGWDAEDAGFGIGWKAIIVSAVVLTALLVFVSSRHLFWPMAAIEAFARTGEEVFFRGFLFTLIWQFAQKKEKPSTWAVVGSSLAFALVHTQTFQAGGVIDQGVILVVERFINLFLFGVVLSFIRFRIGSILPGALTHATLNGGTQTIPFVLVFYATGWIWCRVCELNRARGILQSDGTA